MYAQTEIAPFSELNAGINLEIKKNKNISDNYWSPKKGADVYVETPFYFGYISAGFTYLPFSSKDTSRPDYTARLLYLGWGNKLLLPLNTAFYFGIKLGNYSMSFNDDTVNVNLQTESEFAAGITTALCFEPIHRVNINFRADFFNVFTRIRMRQILLGAGISYNFNSPDWFKEIFN